MQFNQLYDEGLSYLNSLTNFENFKTFPKYNTRNYHLDDFEEILNAIGSPHCKYPIIHIAGSKGKGSTALMLERVLSVSGYRVGLYMSPHLRSVRERISVSGEIISQNDFGNLESNGKSEYKRFDSAYRYAFVSFKINGKAYLIQPTDYVGEVQLEKGKYTYKISVTGLNSDYALLEFIED